MIMFGVVFALLAIICSNGIGVRAQPASSPTWTELTTALPSGCTFGYQVMYSLQAVNSGSYIQFIMCADPFGLSFYPNEYDGSCTFCTSAPISLDAGADYSLFAADVAGNLWVNDGASSFSSLAKANSNFAVQVSIGSAAWLAYIDADGNAYYLKGGLSGGAGWYTLPNGYNTDISIGRDGYCITLETNGANKYYIWQQLSAGAGAITSGTLPSGFYPTGTSVFDSYNVIAWTQTEMAWLTGGLNTGNSWKILSTPGDPDMSTSVGSMFYPSLGEGLITFIYSEHGPYMTTFAGAGCVSTCEAGTYANCGTTTCIDCPGGTFSKVVGATSLSTCDDCGAGLYSEYPSGSTNCMFCAGGYQTPGPAATSCSQCPPGWYTPEPFGGQTTCYWCLEGTYSTTAGGSSVSSCLGCPDCYWSLSGATSCFLCLPGPDRPMCAAVGSDGNC